MSSLGFWLGKSGELERNFEFRIPYLLCPVRWQIAGGISQRTQRTKRSKEKKRLLVENTPTEVYSVNGTAVYVKRDDLFGQYPAPPLAKLRGASILLSRLKREGVKRVGVYDTTVSKAGQGIAFLASELEMECWLGFPLLARTKPAESKLIAEKLGARLFPLKAGRTAVCYHQFKHIVEENKGLMLPLGLVCKDTVLEVAREAAKVSEQYKPNTIVLCTGTGTIATGVALGADAQVYGVSCGMSTLKQWKRMRELAFPEAMPNVILIPPRYDYYTALDTSKCPFPTSPWYDMKAWEWLVENLNKLEQPVIFWNIGC